MVLVEYYFMQLVAPAARSRGRALARQGLLCLLAATLLGAATAAGEPYSGGSLFSTEAPQGKACAPPESLPLAGVNLTDEELALLPYICWPTEQPEPVSEERLQARRGFPPGVNCTATQWCDGSVCTDVCARGSVSIEPWLASAARLQAALARELPLCLATLLGTHNSAISLADGYGNLDDHFREYFRYIRWAVGDFADAPLRTNDQWLSLTDQLNLGVRSVELDTHWVGGVLRIAHCGGLHLEPLNQLIKALNLVAKLMRHPIRWDTETMGCDPSLSSIPALEQRPLTEALAEVAAWLAAPGNEAEFLMVYFDDQPDLLSWGVAEHLQQDILGAFARESVFTTDDLAATGGWPTLNAMVAEGKRVMFVSGADYGPAMRPLVFARGEAVCRWAEPPLATIDAAPDCVITPSASAAAAAASTAATATAAANTGEGMGGLVGRGLFNGSLVRVSTCQLEYGPLNCDFVWRGSNEPFFDETTLPAVLGCGLNIPAPDLMTPARAAAAIWTWAPGHPLASPGGRGLEVEDRVLSKGASASAHLTLRRPVVREAGAEAASCSMVGAQDGRWRSVSCSLELPTACRRAGTALGSRAGQWVLGSGPRGTCPEGTAADLPRHPRENYQLAAALRAAVAPGAWLPMVAPSWEVPGVPLTAAA